MSQYFIRYEGKVRDEYIAHYVFRFKRNIISEKLFMVSIIGFAGSLTANCLEG